MGKGGRSKPRTRGENVGFSYGGAKGPNMNRAARRLLGDEAVRRVAQRKLTGDAKKEEIINSIRERLQGYPIPEVDACIFLEFFRHNKDNMRGPFGKIKELRANGLIPPEKLKAIAEKWRLRLREKEQMPPQLVPFLKK